MRKYRFLAVALVALLSSLIGGCESCDRSLPSSDLEADVIFFNGDVVTMEPDRPQAEAVAILGEKIIGVGSDDDVNAMAGPGTQMIDLQGRTLLPGFIDSHSHWIGDDQRTGFDTVDDTIQYLLENGWTSINEMFTSPDDLEFFQTLDQEGRLKVRINAYLPVNYREQYFGHPYEAYTPHQFVSPHVRLAGVKFITESYYGETLYFTQEELNQEFAAVQEAGWQIAVHTEYIAGHDMVLQALDYALGGESNEPYRHRIEHVFGINDDQLEEIRQTGYIASIQLNLPGNFYRQDPTFYDRMTEDDFPLFCRWRDLYDAGVLIVGGTDWPWLTNDTFVESGGAPAGSPLRLIYKAATHTDPDDVIPDAWMDGQFLPVEASLQALTIDGAYATFEEDAKGSLATGKLADMVVLSDNPITVAETDIRAIRGIEVLMTMIGGEVEYCAPGAASLCPDTGVTPGTSSSTVLPGSRQTAEIRLRMVTTSDWSNVSLISGATWSDPVLLGTEGEDVQVDVGDSQISMGQPLAQAKAGEQVEATYELQLAKTDETRQLVFRVDRGNLGATTVELYRDTGRGWELVDEFTWSGIADQGSNSATFEVPGESIFDE